MLTSTVRRLDRDRLEAWRARGASQLVTPPAVEPVDVDLLLRHSNRPNDSRLDYDLMPLRIQAAREWVEQYTGRALITQTWRYTVDYLTNWSGLLLLPKSPLIDVTSIIATDPEDVETTLSASDYRVEAAAGRVLIDTAVGYWVTNPRQYAALSVTYRAGYGATAESVPATFRHVIMLLASEFSERLEAASDLKLADVPYGVKALLDPYVVVR
jgi:uncharacterized phiE125 gp8 family phage protein